jgi:hypothetical protein
MAVRAVSGDAAGSAEAAALAEGLMTGWPDFVPGLLHGAITAGRRDQPARAAELFERVARLAEERGEAEDAALAHAAAAAAEGAASAARAARAARAEARIVVSGGSTGGELAAAAQGAVLATLTDQAVARRDLDEAELLFARRR